MKVAAQTDVGRVREYNEDGLHVDADLGLLIVADGIGGQQGGEVASALAVQVIATVVKDALATTADTEQFSQLLRRGIHSAHEEICARAAANPVLHNMGTTVVLALCQRDTMHIAHVGDSRAYLLHHGRMRQLTEAHSVVAELIKAGQLTPRAARHHRLRHLITRSLGGPESACPDMQCLPWAPGDFLLLCSDGLTNMVEERAIKKLIVQGEQTCRPSVRSWWHWQRPTDPGLPYHADAVQQAGPLRHPAQLWESALMGLGAWASGPLRSRQDVCACFQCVL